MPLQAQAKIERFARPSRPSYATGFYASAMERLVKVTEDLSAVQSIEDVTEIVRHAARQLTGADGATLVLRDADKCFYAGEDAIAPLWTGQRFPMRICVSGWVMTHRETLFISDIYADPRVPVDLYRPTFVRSMMMVPIRHNDPIGAIGNYWATPRNPSLEEGRVLQMLADMTSLALETVRLRTEINRVGVREAE